MRDPTALIVPSVSLLPQSRERLQEFHRALQAARDTSRLQAALKAASFERLCEQLARLRQQAEPWRGRMFYRPAYPKASQPVKRRRKPGGGRKPRLTRKQIASGRDLYRREIAKDPTVQKQMGALEFLRPLFSASDPTLLRWIVRPVLRDSK